MSPNVQVKPPEGEVVGWGAEARWTDAEAWTVSRYVGRELARLGVRDAFAVIGGGVAPFADGLRRALRVIHTRHEGGAAFAAVEAHFASSRPVAIVVTTGPGLFNALNGAMAARADGAKVIVLSGVTTRNQLGRGAVQETGPFTMPSSLVEAGKLFHFAARPETLGEVQHALQQIAIGWSRPGGFVAHLALPMSLQTQLVDESALRPVASWSIAEPDPSPAVIDTCLARLSEGSAALWLGHGARGASAELRAFAEAAALPVLCSPRAKGVFDEDHPLYIGTSGAGGHATVMRYFAEHRPDTLLVIGSRLGEVTSFLSEQGTPARQWIHVDLDPSACGAAFPGIPGLAVIAEARAFLRALNARAEATGWFARRAPVAAPHVGRPAHLEPRATGDVRPAYLMQVVQELVVEGSDAIVMSEAGNAFTWCNHALRFRAPGRYRTSAAWGSMGHFTCGPLGAALAGRRKAVAVVGDGAMLMQNELHSAVAYGADAVWIILNDAQLGLNEHGMRALGMQQLETQFPRTDFVAYARSQGAGGVAVEHEGELAAAIGQALAATGPFIVDVRTCRETPSPILALRTQSLQNHRGA